MNYRRIDRAVYYNDTIIILEEMRDYENRTKHHETPAASRPEASIREH